jgi:GMP synthase-like glutamine amidotransferase
MRVLALVHQNSAPPGTFGWLTVDRGHELDVRSLVPGAGEPPPDDAAGRYGAVMVFGGSMQVDQDDDHPWLRDERALVRDLLDREVPTLGVCLGAQMIAQTAGTDVGPATVPEIGWHPVELTADGVADSVLGGAPPRFAAYQGHSYGFGLPQGATALAHGQGDALQAYRIGDSAWGIQFHPEVSAESVSYWIGKHAAEGDIDDEAALREQTAANLPRWTAFGRTLCGRFLDYAAMRSADSASDQ